MATDLWHGTSAMIRGVLMQVGAVLMCVIMLRGGVFGRVTACIGIATYGLDLLHIFAMAWPPAVLPQGGDSVVRATSRNSRAQSSFSVDTKPKPFSIACSFR